MAAKPKYNAPYHDNWAWSLAAMGATNEEIALAMKDAEGLTESEVRDVILGVKGIGPKKAEDIVKALTEAQKERS